jgi:hypothetical protein
VFDLGQLPDYVVSTHETATIGLEGAAYFQTSVGEGTKGWRLWLNGSSLPIYVKKNTAPVVSPWTSYYEQTESGQMLLVPDYLTRGLYVIGVSGSPDTSFALDSSKQNILAPREMSSPSSSPGPMTTATATSPMRFKSLWSRSPGR